MNCKNCNAIIEYNYLTACPQCGWTVEGGDLPQLDPQPKESRHYFYYLGNIFHVLATSLAGAFIGAVGFYYSVAVGYWAHAAPDRYPGPHCGGWGTIVSMWSIVLGAFFGTIAGAIYGNKHPVLKGWNGINSQSLASKVSDQLWKMSVPPAVAGGSAIRIQNH